MSKFLLFTFVMILCLIPFNDSVSINKLNSNILTRRQVVSNACYVKANPSQRSTTIVLINQSGTDLFYVSSTLIHGIWTSGCDPAPIKTVPNGQSISFSNQSGGFATGAQGSVVYSIGNETPPLTFTIHWDNPFSGSNTYGVDLPDSKYAYNAPYPPSGNNAYYEITISLK